MTDHEKTVAALEMKVKALEKDLAEAQRLVLIVKTIRVCLAMICLTVLLYANASHFDYTEMTVIFWFFLALVGVEFGDSIRGAVASLLKRD